MPTFFSVWSFVTRADGKSKFLTSMRTPSMRSGSALLQVGMNGINVALLSKKHLYMLSVPCGTNAPLSLVFKTHMHGRVLFLQDPLVCQN